MIPVWAQDRIEERRFDGFLDRVSATYLNTPARACISSSEHPDNIHARRGATITRRVRHPPFHFLLSFPLLTCLPCVLFLPPSFLPSTRLLSCGFAAIVGGLVTCGFFRPFNFAILFKSFVAFEFEQGITHLWCEIANWFQISSGISWPFGAAGGGGGFRKRNARQL